MQKNQDIQNLEQKFDILVNKLNSQTEHFNFFINNINNNQKTFSEIDKKIVNLDAKIDQKLF